MKRWVMDQCEDVLWQFERSKVISTSGVAARDARLHSLSLELLSLSESDSELLSDSLELPEAPLEWPVGSPVRGVVPGRL